MSSILKIDWATHEAARHACENWHYSKTFPVGKTVKVGAWEDGKFIGVAIFCWGMNQSLGSPYGLQLIECCELVRMAFCSHKCQISQVLALAIKFLKKQSSGLKLIVSFADPVEGHHGGIYQATNWIYSGQSNASFEWRLNGKRLNKRAFTGQQFGKGKNSVAKVPIGAMKVTTPGKHRYLYPLTEATRQRILPLARPYPKRAGSIVVDALASHAGEGGAEPTPALHTL